jgi:hypothetical protein
VFGNNFLSNHHAADVGVGNNNSFQADVSTFQQVFTYMVQVQCCVHIDTAISVVKGSHQFPLQLLATFLHILVD